MKKIISTTFVLALLASAGYSVNKNMENAVSLSELALNNVEALADYEIKEGPWIVTIYSPDRWDCRPDGGSSCPGTPW